MVHQPPPPSHVVQEGDDAFASADELAALRAWYQGLSARQAVTRYLTPSGLDGQSSRAVLTAVRKKLQAFAMRRHRKDLAKVLDHSSEKRTAHAREALAAIEAMRQLPAPSPALVDSVDLWLPGRAALALKAAGLPTLADVAAKASQRKRWWTDVPRLGVTTARELEGLLAQLPVVQRAVIPASPATTSSYQLLSGDAILPLELDGTFGTLRAPVEECTLDARNDLQAVRAWLGLHGESKNTRRAYQKEVERLLLWATQVRGKPLSSLKHEDAVAYRAFLLSSPPMSSQAWKRYTGALSPRSAGYAVLVVSAMFRWLVAQRYLKANPFAGLKVKGAKRTTDFDTSHMLRAHEWALMRIEADMLEFKHGWSPESAWRLRFILDFGLATALRASELVSATLGNIERNEGEESWLHVRGKGDKPARVHLPPLAIKALERYLAQRNLPVTTAYWHPDTPLIPPLSEDPGRLSTSRLWAILKRFFLLAAEQLESVNPALAAKLQRMTPHWMRHSHASQAAKAGVPLTVIRDNLRHADISTTSGYLNQDDEERASHLRKVFN